MITRRRVLVGGSSGLLVGLGSPGLLRPTAANPLLLAVGWRVLWNFASAVGASVVAEQINTWLKSRSPESQAAVKSINERAAITGVYTDFSKTSVFEANENFFYPIKSMSSSVNFRTPILDTEGSGDIAILESPSVIGLNEASKSLQNIDNFDSRQIYGALFPVESISNVIGDFDESYSEADEFRTEDGKVVINYNNESREDDGGTGTITVTAVRHNGTTIFTDEIDVSYNHNE